MLPTVLILKALHLLIRFTRFWNGLFFRHCPRCSALFEPFLSFLIFWLMELMLLIVNAFALDDFFGLGVDFFSVFLNFM